MNKFEKFVMTMLVMMFVVMVGSLVVNANQKSKMLDNWNEFCGEKRKESNSRLRYETGCRYYREGFIVDTDGEVWLYTINEDDIVPEGDWEWIPCYVVWDTMGTNWYCEDIYDDAVLGVFHNTQSIENWMKFDNDAEVDKTKLVDIKSVEEPELVSIKDKEAK